MFYFSDHFWVGFNDTFDTQDTRFCIWSTERENSSLTWYVLHELRYAVKSINRILPFFTVRLYNHTNVSDCFQTVIWFLLWYMMHWFCVLRLDIFRRGWAINTDSEGKLPALTDVLHEVMCFNYVEVHKFKLGLFDHFPIHRLLLIICQLALIHIGLHKIILYKVVI